MARTSIPVQEVPLHGAALDDISWTAADATNDHDFANTGREILLMKNGDASQHTASVISVADQHGRTGDQDLAPAAGEISAAGPFEPSVWNSELGKAYVDVGVGEDTSVTFAVLRLLGA